MGPSDGSYGPEAKSSHLTNKKTTGDKAKNKSQPIQDHATDTQGTGSKGIHTTSRTRCVGTRTQRTLGASKKKPHKEPVWSSKGATLPTHRLLELGGVVLVDAASVVELHEHLAPLHLRVVYLHPGLLLQEGLAHEHLPAKTKKKVQYNVHSGGYFTEVTLLHVCGTRIGSERKACVSGRYL